jgi:PIN domain nuclease of toxin-antitoxin system
LNLLADTHVLLWFMADSPDLTASHRSLIENEDNEIFVSAASIFEITTKTRIGKLVLPPRYQISLMHLYNDFDFRPLEIKSSHTDLAGRMPSPHKDLWDRMLAAQSIIEDMDLLSIDKRLEELGARVVR